MEAAVRAFEDWEFRVLEQESGLDDEDESTSDRDARGGSERETSCQQHVVNAAQVNVRVSHLLSDARDRSRWQLVSVPMSACPCLPSQADGGLTFTQVPKITATRHQVQMRDDL